jgi:hypothetical protein
MTWFLPVAGHGRRTYLTANPQTAPGCSEVRPSRFDKLAVRYQATIHIAAISEWLRHDL